MEDMGPILAFIKDHNVFLGIIILLLGAFILIVGFVVMIWNFGDKIARVEQQVSRGYTSVLADRDALIGDFGDTFEPIDFVATDDNFVVLTKYGKVDGEHAAQIRLDAFQPDGNWLLNFGGLDSGYRLLEVGLGGADPRRVFALPGGGLAVIGNATSSNSTTHAFIAILESDGTNRANFNNGGPFFLAIDEQPVRSCFDAVFESETFYLLCSDIPNVGGGVMALNLDGTLAQSFGNQGISDAMPNGSIPIALARDIRSNGFFVASKQSVQARRQGSVIKTDSQGFLNTAFGSGGVQQINSLLQYNGFMNRVDDIEVLPSGSVIVIGSANNGFVVALDNSGHPDVSIGASGRIDVRSYYQFDSCCVVKDAAGNIVVGGMEYDGNSVMNGLISFFDSNGKPIKQGGKQIVQIQEGRPTKVVRLRVRERDGKLFALTKDGGISGMGFSTFDILNIDVSDRF